jgi:hypothetical protein
MADTVTKIDRAPVLAVLHDIFGVPEGTLVSATFDGNDFPKAVITPPTGEMHEYGRAILRALDRVGLGVGRIELTHDKVTIHYPDNGTTETIGWADADE